MTELSENQLWYVRAAVFRGMESVRDVIGDAEKYLADDTVPATFRQATENMLAYHKQMLREMEQYIPKEFQ